MELKKETVAVTMRERERERVMIIQSGVMGDTWYLILAGSEMGRRFEAHSLIKWIRLVLDVCAI